MFVDEKEPTTEGRALRTPLEAASFTSLTLHIIFRSGSATEYFVRDVLGRH